MLEPIALEVTAPLLYFYEVYSSGLFCDDIYLADLCLPVPVNDYVAIVFQQAGYRRFGF